MKILSTARFMLTFAMLAAMPFGLSACDTVAEDSEAIAEQPPQAVEQSPPVEQVEQIPSLDRTSQVWRPGYWAMKQNQFVWIPGKILARPDPTAVWYPAHWDHHTYGWSFAPGHWE